MKLTTLEKSSIKAWLQATNTSALEEFLDQFPAKAQDFLQFLQQQINDHQYPILPHLINNGQDHLAGLLIRFGINLHIKDEVGESALHIATRVSNYDLMEKILQNDIELHQFVENMNLIDEFDANENTALLLALKNKDNNAIALLIKYNANFYLPLKNNVYYYKEYLYTDYLDVLLQQKPDIELDILTKILNCCNAFITNKKPSSDDLQKLLDKLACKLTGTFCEQFNKNVWGEMLANLISMRINLRIDNKSYQLGEEFVVKANYLLLHVRCLLELILNPSYQNSSPISKDDLIRELKLAVESAKAAEALTLLQVFDVKNGWNGRLIPFYKMGLQNKLASLKEGETFTCPAGWYFGEYGHAIDVNFTKQKNSWHINVANLGDGAPDELKVTAKKMVSAAQIIPEDRPRILSVYLSDLIWLSTRYLSEKDEERQSKRIYSHAVFGNPLNSLTAKSFAEVIQVQANCIVKNDLYAQRLRLNNDDVYRFYFLFYVRMSLHHLASTGENPKGLPSVSEIAKRIQLSQASFVKCSKVKIIEALSEDWTKLQIPWMITAEKSKKDNSLVKAKVHTLRVQTVKGNVQMNNHLFYQEKPCQNLSITRASLRSNQKKHGPNDETTPRVPTRSSTY